MPRSARILLAGGRDHQGVGGLARVSEGYTDSGIAVRFCPGEESVPQSDQEVFQSARRELFSAVIGDVMDKMGLLQQFLPPAIVPLDRSMVVWRYPDTDSMAGMSAIVLGSMVAPICALIAGGLVIWCARKIRIQRSPLP